MKAGRMELPLKERQEIWGHIDKCRACAREFHTITAILKKEKEFLQKLEKETSQDRETTRPWIFQKKPVWAAAAAIFLVLAGAVFFLVLNRPDQVRMRSRGSAVPAYAPDGIVHTAKIKFAWGKTRGAEFYRLRIYGDDLLPIWESGRIYTTQWIPSPELWDKLEGGKTYFWMVTAFREDGSTRESELTRFKLGPG